MDLQINQSHENSLLTNIDTKQFIEELSENLEIGNLIIYNLHIDNGEFTNENLEKIKNYYNEIVQEFAKENNQNEIYSILKINKSYNIIRKYDSDLGKITDMQISTAELPIDSKEGLILKKINNEFIIDKDMTQNIYYKMKEYETNLLNEQQKYLKKMRKNGELYYVRSVERRL